ITHCYSDLIVTLQSVMLGFVYARSWSSLRVGRDAGHVPRITGIGGCSERPWHHPEGARRRIWLDALADFAGGWRGAVRLWVRRAHRRHADGPLWPTPRAAGRSGNHRRWPRRYAPDDAALALSGG